MLKFRRKKKPIGAIDMAPMVDVVFQLVIYFLVASSLQENTAVKVNLPESKKTAAVDTPKQIVVTVDGAGKIYLGAAAQPVPLAALGQKVLKVLESQGEGGKKQQVIIRGDSATQYKTIIGVMDELALRGVKNFNLSVRRASGKSGL